MINRNRIKLVTLFILSISFFSGKGQETYWNRINPKPFESTISSATLIPGTNKVIAVGNIATVMYSDDNGDSWDLERRPAGIGKGQGLISVSFPSQNTGYILGDKSLLLKTTEGGENWYDISLEGTVNYKSTYFLDNYNGFITGASGYILRTSDGGASWDTIPIIEGVSPGRLHFIDSMTGFMGNTYGDYFLRSTDAGYTWEFIYLDSLWQGYHLTGLRFLNDTVGFATIFNYQNYGGVIKTTDGGSSWYPVFSDGLATPDQFLFTGPDTGFAYGPAVYYKDVILHTTDQGETWTEVGSCPWSLNSMLFTEDDIGIMFGSVSRIYRSLNQGLTWQNEYSSFFTSTFLDAVILNDSVIVAGGAAAGGGVLTGSIIRSEDGGWQWTERLESSGYIVDIDFVDENEGYAISNNSDLYYKTTDGGKNWSWVLLTHPECYDICFLNRDTGFIAGNITSNEGILKTTDGGATWDTISPGHLQNIYGNIYDIDFASPTVGYMTGEIWVTGRIWPGKVMKTVDGGDNWFSLGLDIDCEEMKDIEIIDENTVYVTGCDFILKTENGGESWSYLNLPNENTINFNSVSFVNENLGFAVGSGEEETILKTTNAGVSWEILESPTPVNLTRATFFNENQGLIFGNAGVIFRLDTGLFVHIDEPLSPGLSENSIKIYPNPAAEYTRIGPLSPDEDYHHIKIYNVQGILVKSVRIDQEKRELTITFPEIPPGVYFIKLIGKRSEQTFKLIKLN
jgi:photosystem II stability/assembly factor-like uncharacterized protein